MSSIITAVALLATLQPPQPERTNPKAITGTWLHESKTRGTPPMGFSRGSSGQQFKYTLTLKSDGTYTWYRGMYHLNEQTNRQELRGKTQEGRWRIIRVEGQVGV